MEQVARALGISVAEAEKKYGIKDDAKSDTSGFKGYAGYGEPGKDFSNEKPSDFIANETFAEQSARNQVTNDRVTDFAKAAFPGFGLVSALATLFGEQAPATVVDAGTYAGMFPTSAESGRGIPGESEDNAKNDTIDANQGAAVGGDKGSISDQDTGGDGGGYGGYSDPAGHSSFGSGEYAYGGLTALAQGGMYNLGDYSDGGRLLRGPGDGVSDSIPATIGKKRPARLADGEFVVPARIVSELGNGSTEAGARKLYAMMDRIQAARRSSIGKGKVAKNSRADKYLPA
jgi:hypothetical protein